ncbi:MAG: nucleotidyltransferase domain-containing protein [Candidatus Nanoarchaeia archaeon]|nr:nucleotidyltransferase domain-containing protein [Candidatus Nanoarchaeia archaeon]
MTQIKINYQFEVLLALLKKDLHGRELAKELKTSLTRIQLILNELSQYNILDYNKEGKNHIYFIKKNIIAKTFILSAENYKLAKLLCKYNTLEPLFKEITQKYPNQMIILFGSYAKFNPKEDSDIDIYIDSIDKKVKETINNINEKISVKFGEFNKEDLLIQEIIKNHIILQGGERFYEKLGFFK